MDDGQANDVTAGAVGRWCRTAIAVAAIGAILAGVAGCSSGGSDAVKPTTTTSTTAPASSTTTTLPKVHPERDVKVVSCGAKPVVRVTNSSKKPSKYVFLIEAKAKGGSGVSVKVPGKADKVGPGASVNVTLTPMSPVPAGAACTVAQVIKTVG